MSREFYTNLEYYKVFYYVAKLGSLTAAAEQMYLTQPNVTKTIRKLEQQLGCTLFVRTKRGVELTNEGQMLWSRVEPACHLLLAAEQELEAAHQLEGGELRIASTEIGFKNYVLPALQQFTKDHPNVKVKFYSALTGRILEMLRAGSIDIAVLHTPFDQRNDMEMYHIDVCPECFAAGPRYAFLADRTNQLADLQQYPIVSMQEGSATEAYLSNLFQKQGLTFEPDIEVTNTELAIQVVENNLGLGILPWQNIRERVERGTLFPIPLAEEIPERDVYVLTGKTVPLSNAAKVFIGDYILPVNSGSVI